MNLEYFSYPLPANEPVHTYAPGTTERTALKKTLAELKAMFDAAIRKGNSFRDVKRIYVRMKHLKRYLKSINVE